MMFSLLGISSIGVGEAMRKVQRLGTSHFLFYFAMEQCLCKSACVFPLALAVNVRIFDPFYCVARSTLVYGPYVFVYWNNNLLCNKPVRLR